MEFILNEMKNLQLDFWAEKARIGLTPDAGRQTPQNATRNC
jgi:hypothetical protein